MTNRFDGEVLLHVAYVTGGPLGLDGVFPDGQYVNRSNGRWSVKQFGYGGMSGYEAEPGVSVGFDPPWRGGEPTLGSMPSVEWVKVVETLRDVSPAIPVSPLSGRRTEADPWSRRNAQQPAQRQLGRRIEEVSYVGNMATEDVVHMGESIGNDHARLWCVQGSLPSGPMGEPGG